MQLGPPAYARQLSGGSQPDTHQRPPHPQCPPGQQQRVREDSGPPREGHGIPPNREGHGPPPPEFNRLSVLYVQEVVIPFISKLIYRSLLLGHTVFDLRVKYTSASFISHIFLNSEKKEFF